MNTPFSSKHYIYVFEKYNTDLFPAQLIILALGIIAILFLHTKSVYRNFFISSFLGLIWLWMGIVYYLCFFASINNAAYIFGGLLIIQGIIFFSEAIFRTHLTFEFDGSIRNYIGYFFILFGLLLYPLIGYIIESNITKIISLGLPCPIAILTFGFLMITNKSFPKYILIIPTVWALIGFTAILNFGIYQDIALLISAIVANIWLCTRKRNMLDSVA